MTDPVPTIAIRALQPRRRRGGLDFTDQPREFTSAGFLKCFQCGLAAAIALAAIIADPLLEVKLVEDGKKRDLTDEEIAELTGVLEVEQARVDPNVPPTDVAAAAKAEAERAEAERMEAERADAERAEAERMEAERAEAERAEAERMEAERAKAERAEADRAGQQGEANAEAAAEAEKAKAPPKAVPAEKAKAPPKAVPAEKPRAETNTSGSGRKSKT